MADYWLPDLDANRFGLQWKVFNSKARCLLVSGPRYSGKTIAALNKIVRHMWDTPGASVAMFSKTMKNSKEGGTWLDMHRSILPPWIAADMGMVYTSLNNEGDPGWKVIGDTRTPYFSIRNRYGGESECRLFSLDHTPDVVDKVKEQRFSLIYFSELMKFNDRIVLSATMPCLRMMHLKFEDQFWMADTNPSEEGDQSWIYKLWFQERLWTYDQYVEECQATGREPETAVDFQRSKDELELIELYPEDNLYLDPRVLSELKRHCSYDPGLYQRDVKGKWIWGEGDASRHFRSFFKPTIHVLGNIESPEEENWEVIKPNPTSSELVTGFDLGETNHAAVIIDPIYVNGRKHFSVLDELESLSKRLKVGEFSDRKPGDWVSVEDFTLEFMEIIKAIELDAGRTFNLERAYSDASALEKYSSAGDTFPAIEIQAASRGRINVIGVPKPDGSVKVRVNLVKLLLSQGRLKISAQCVAVQRMLRELKKGAGRLNYVVADENKHIFDALTYPLIVECAEELVTQEERMSVGPRRTLLVQA